MRFVSHATLVLFALLAPLALSSASCSDIDPLVLGTCGNGVLEASEQCDFTAGFAPSGMTCGADCKFTCTGEGTTAMCPAGFACKNGVCADREVCGNGKKEESAGEECDGSDVVANARCGAAGDGERACHFTCDAMPPTGAGICPGGYSCNAQALCVFPSGKFSPTAKVSFAGLDMSVADFDGDSFPDIASIFGHDLEIRYGDGAGGFAASQRYTFQSPTPAFAAADFDGDHFADGVIPQERGLIILRGREDRGLVTQLDSQIPIPQAGFQPARLTHVKTASTAPYDLLFAVTSGGGMLRVFVIDRPGPQHDEAFYDLPATQSSTSARMSIADLDAADASREEEVILALMGDNRVRVFSPELGVSAEGQPEWHVVLRSELAVSEPINDSPRIADLDGDGLWDLIIPVGGLAPEDTKHLMTARGTGDARFVPFDGAPSPTYDMAIETLFDAGRRDQVEISGAVDFNGDRVSDLITSDFVALSTGPHAWVAKRGSELFGPEIISEIGDFNGDGDLDFASASIAERGVSFNFGDSQGNFRSSFVSTSHFPQYLKVGDFDGDGVDDICVGERLAIFSRGATSISVIYGNAFSRPDASVEMGELERIGTIEALDLAFPPDAPDGVSDLLVISDPLAQEIPTTVSTLLGNSSRRLLSPLVLSAMGPPETPSLVTTGNFDGDEYPDLVVMTTSSAWMLSGQKGGLSNSNSTVVGLGRFTDCLHIDRGSAQCSLLLKGNVLGEPDGEPSVDEVVFADACRLDATGEVTISWLRAPRDREAWTCSKVTIQTPFRSPRAYAVADLDGNGVDDLAFAFAANYLPPEFEQGAPELSREQTGAIILWGGAGARGFDLSEITSIGYDDIQGAALGIGTINIDRDRERELVIMRPESLQLSEVSRDGISETGIVPPGGAGFLFTKIVSRDVSSDGLEDLLVKDDSGVQVLVAEPGGAR